MIINQDMIQRLVMVVVLLLLDVVTSAKANVQHITNSNNNNNSFIAFHCSQNDLSTKIIGLIAPEVIYFAQPLNACSDLEYKIGQVTEGSSSSPPFVYITSGECLYEEKARNAQNAGFKAAIIVYDDNRMGGDAVGIRNHSVFVDILKKYTVGPGAEVLKSEKMQERLHASFVQQFLPSRVQETPHSRVQETLHSRVRKIPSFVKALPSMIFIAVTEDNCTSRTCAICLEDYNAGEKLRILPCRHKFHASCVDFWLTTRKTFCPICKRDARKPITGQDRPPSENAPLFN
ncbi:hypothetical protein ACFE04_004543 [Oxalis oulophora]